VEIFLPTPGVMNGAPFEEVLRARRSVREYLPEALTLSEVSFILWATQGISEVHEPLRTAPSAGARYPVIIYLITGEGGIEDLKEGIYRCVPERHSLLLRKEGDYRAELAEASLAQEHVALAPAIIAFAVEFWRTTSRYGERGYRYVWIDVGHAAQNTYLAASALGLGTVGVGAFNDEEVAKVLGLSQKEHPAYLMPLGRPPPDATRSSSWEEIREYLTRNRERKIMPP